MTSRVNDVAAAATAFRRRPPRENRADRRALSSHCARFFGIRRRGSLSVLAHLVRARGLRLLVGLRLRSVLLAFLHHIGIVAGVSFVYFVGLACLNGGRYRVLAWIFLLSLPHFWSGVYGEPGACDDMRLRICGVNHTRALHAPESVSKLDAVLL